ncbi:MAG TPA: glycoside hydrolase family 125 protein [Candidatus Baltobacteraceae bacterium]
MIKSLLAIVLLAQTLMVPMTGERARPTQSATLFHTLFNDFFDESDGTTYVQTGDIPAMWLRDSSAQTIPYLRFERTFPALRSRFAGVIERNARNIAVDPYANAFMANYHVWERKWEIDSLAAPSILASIYWRSTGDRTIFTPALRRALRIVVDTLRCEQIHKRCSPYVYPYRVKTDDAYAAGTGLIWSAFRPSDDPVLYRFNIPQNAAAVVALRAIAEMATDGYADPDVAREATTVADAVQVGIARYGVVWNASRKVWMYAYEVDGYGRVNFMDDANIPNLTTLPYLGWCSSFDQIYLNTRAFALSPANPYYFSGTYAQGLGSPHTNPNFVWPLGIIGRALTATGSAEVAQQITTLAETDGKDGLIHESFYDGGYWRYTRAEFGWANALYAELLFRSTAGFRAMPFVDGDEAIIPFQRPARTPTLASPLVQIHNSGLLYTTLGDLLAQAPNRR